MPTLRKNSKLWTSVKNQVLHENIGGTKSGQWSARKALIAVKRYKDRGGTYIGPKSKNNSLTKWVHQQWTTKSGRPSHITGERYLPKKAFDHLSKKEIQIINRSKKKSMKRGIQYSKMPKSISKKIKKYRQ